MAVDFDSAEPPTSPEQLAGLVDAVTRASDSDEHDWIEWKSDYDVAGKVGQGMLARHILGMANRLPEAAAQHCGGWGFVVVGATPGNRPGMAAVDPADLTRGVAAYLGQVRPDWTPHYDHRDNVHVLVVNVRPPRPGDPMYALARDMSVKTPGGKTKEYLRGTIFVRHPGRTEQADAEHVAALLERYAAPFREADALARESVRTGLARQAAEDRERQRRRLLEILSLINSIFSQAYPLANTYGYWRCREQLDVHSHLIDIGVELRACETLAGAGQAAEAVRWGAEARNEVEAVLHRLASGQDA